MTSKASRVGAPAFQSLSASSMDWDAVGILFDFVEYLLGMRFRHGLKVLSENRGVYVESRRIELHGGHFKGDFFAVGLFEKDDGVRAL